MRVHHPQLDFAWQSQLDLQFSTNILDKVGLSGFGMATDQPEGEHELGNECTNDNDNAVQLFSPLARSAGSRLGRRRPALTLRTNQESISQKLTAKIGSQADARTAAIVSAAEAGRLLSAALAQFAPRSEADPPDSSAQNAYSGAQCVEQSMESWSEMTEPSKSEAAGAWQPNDSQLLMCSTQSPSLSRG